MTHVVDVNDDRGLQLALLILQLLEETHHLATLVDLRAEEIPHPLVLVAKNLWELDEARQGRHKRRDCWQKLQRIGATQVAQQCSCVCQGFFFLGGGGGEERPDCWHLLDLVNEVLCHSP